MPPPPRARTIPHLPPTQFLCCRSLRPNTHPKTATNHILATLLSTHGGMTVPTRADPLEMNELWTEYELVVGVVISNPNQHFEKENEKTEKKDGLYVEFYGVNGGKTTITHLSPSPFSRPPVLTPTDSLITTSQHLIRLSSGVDFNCKSHGGWRFTVYEVRWQGARSVAEITAEAAMAVKKEQEEREAFGLGLGDVGMEGGWAEYGWRGKDHAG